MGFMKVGRGAIAGVIVTTLLALPGRAEAQPAPVASYALDEGSGTIVHDSSGNGNDGTVSQPLWEDGAFGQALAFTDPTSSVTISDSPSLRPANGITVEAWVNPSSLASPTGNSSFWILSKKYGTSALSYGLTVLSGLAAFRVGTAPVTASRTLPPDTWSHVAGTYDGSTVRLYVNGVEIANRSIVQTIAYDAQPLVLNPQSGGATVKGRVDEVRIYDAALDAGGIQADMATSVNGLTTRDTPPTQPGDFTATGGTAPAGGYRADIQLTWSASKDDRRIAAYRIHCSTSPGFTPSVGNLIATVATPGYTDPSRSVGTRYYYRIVAVDSAGQAGPMTPEAVGVVKPPHPIPFAAYGMQEGTGTVVRDSSGQNNKGVARNTTWAIGKYGNALSFDGTSSWVEVSPSPSSPVAASALTIEAWVKPASYGVLNFKSAVVTKDAGTTTSFDYGLWSSMQPSFDNIPQGMVCLASGCWGAGGPALPLNTWSHLAYTFGPDGGRLYINGELVGGHSGAGQGINTSWSTLRIGSSSRGEYFHGLIDEVRVYNVALTRDQILVDMNQPIS
ncbi:LamG-like jellyroll fold domain-containing protein [Microtetraspora fusca]|uniref:LamG-like jellyroll fold domain-containing protein n=1 Tax=Microtetraspora fusca TaxID=1997 RepID=UPI0008335FBD|nr:LamG domain-containing protein [Microtetraspora fusca]